MGPTRRQVLAGVAALAAVGGAGGGAVGVRWVGRPPAAGLRCLSLEEHAFVQAVADAWLPGVPGLADFVDEVLGAAAPDQQAAIKVLLHLYDDLPVLPHLGPFRTLDPTDRVAILAGWTCHELALVRHGIRVILGLMAPGVSVAPACVAP